MNFFIIVSFYDVTIKVLLDTGNVQPAKVHHQNNSYNYESDKKKIVQNQRHKIVSYHVPLECGYRFLLNWNCEVIFLCLCVFVYLLKFIDYYTNLSNYIPFECGYRFLLYWNCEVIFLFLCVYVFNYNLFINY